MIPSVPSEPISIRSGETPAPEPGSRRDSHTPGRGQRPHRLDQVVDVRVEGGEVAAGAGRDPAAERRELKRLREVAQRESVGAELLLEPRAGGAGLDPRRQRHRVDLEHAVERLQVDGHHARMVPAAGRLDAADHARAAAERDHRRARRQRPFEHGLDLGLVARMGDHVRRMVEPPPERPHDVRVGAAVGVQRPLVVVDGADLLERAGGRRRGAGSDDLRRAAPGARVRSQPNPSRPVRNSAAPRSSSGEGCSSS